MSDLDKKKEQAIKKLTDMESKKELLNKKLIEIDKKFGKGAAMYLGSNSALDIARISTGLVAIDNILGGGIPRGRIIEVYGPESSGKTTLTLHIIAETQKNGGLVGFIDAEHALDPNYAATLGVDIDNLIISQPDCGEQALEIAEELVSSGAMDLIVVDSVAALTPRAELEGEMGDSNMGLQARLMSQAMRKLTGVVSKTGCTIIFINQLRDKIGVMFGSPETTTGGKALKFYASIRIDIRKVEVVKENGEAVGTKTKIKIVKNKTASPFKEAIVDIRFGQGFDKELSLIDLAVAKDIIQKSGSWFSYNDEKLGQGRNSVREFFIANPETFKEISEKCKM